MRTLMQDRAFVAYGQIYVQSEDGDGPEAWASMGGQQNGLCGAALPGCIFLITGTHTGFVAFTVELHDTEPPLGAEWEEIVEASFRPVGETSLVCWGGTDAWPLDLDDIDYRVRYCATAMDEGHDSVPRGDDEEDPDRYLLQFWPAPPAPDRVVRQTGAIAAYWHDHARGQPPPPTPEEKAEAQRLADLARREAEERAQLEWEAREWGGTLPSDRVRALQGSARAGAMLDPGLAEALVAVTPADQTLVARWIVRRAFAEAGLTGVAWIAELLTVMDDGGDLTPVLADQRAAWDRLLSDPHVPHTVVTTLDGRADNFLQPAAAFGAVFALGLDDPLDAALEAFWAAANAFGQGRTGELADEVRAAFPALAAGTADRAD